MKRLFIFIAVLLELAACARLPAIKPDEVSSPSAAASLCGHIFPQGRWQLYHLIEATAPGGQKKSLAGVSVLSSHERTIQWALMTVEGFVLFSGRFDGALTIDRAIPPFDRPGFAQGLMEDLMMLFFAPLEPLAMAGRLKTDDRVCRYSWSEKTTDIIIKDDGAWAIDQYSTHRRLSRSIQADGQILIEGHPFAKHLILQNHSLIGYQLELKLVEAIPLDK